MRRWKHWSTGLVAGGLSVVAACATTSPPRELQDARYAYRRVSVGPAASLNVPELAVARQAMDAADRAYERSADSDETRALAYVALRRAELAEARAQTVLAERERAAIEAELQARTQQEQAKTQEELAAARTQLEEAQRMQADAQARQAEIAQSQQAEAQARALADQQAQEQAREAEQARVQEELKKTSEQLEQEKQARAETERQLAEASAERERAQAEAEMKAKEAAEALQRLDQVAVKEEARGTVITLSGTVLFASGKSELLPGARERLDEVAEALKETSNPLVIEGHTDSRGNAEVNEDLSFQRAAAVENYLATRGLERDRIRIVGRGESRPVANNATAEGRANNRRVEIILSRGERG